MARHAALSALASGVFAAAIGCAAAPGAMRSLSNADVTWDGNPAGYAPWFDGAAEARAAAIRKEGAAAIPGLVEALSDPDRFVAAHVLLTEITGVGYEPFPTWNGLVLQVFGGGRATIDPRQRVTLEKRWRRWAAEVPHPSSLPAARE